MAKKRSDVIMAKKRQTWIVIVIIVGIIVGVGIWIHFESIDAFLGDNNMSNILQIYQPSNNIDCNDTIIKTIIENNTIYINNNNNDRLFEFNNVNISELEIYMYPDEIKLFIQTVYNKRNYIEWGSGGSTFLVPFLINKPNGVYSIEHVPEWCQKVNSDSRVKTAKALNYLHFNC